MKPVTVLAFALALTACEGPMGPAGPAGPGTRVVLDATTDSSGEALVELPNGSGTLASPPAVSCYLSETGDLWFVVALDSDTDTDVEAGTDTNVFTGCLLGITTSGSLGVGIFGAPAGWFFRVVVIY
jgi:hypothetical protein